MTGATWMYSERVCWARWRKTLLERSQSFRRGGRRSSARLSMPGPTWREAARTNSIDAEDNLVLSVNNYIYSKSCTSTSLFYRRCKRVSDTADPSNDGIGGLLLKCFSTLLHPILELLPILLCLLGTKVSQNLAQNGIIGLKDYRKMDLRMALPV